jgi:hypothetical protein
MSSIPESIDELLAKNRVMSQIMALKMIKAGKVPKFLADLWETCIRNNPALMDLHQKILERNAESKDGFDIHIFREDGDSGMFCGKAKLIFDDITNLRVIQAIVQKMRRRTFEAGVSNTSFDIWMDVYVENVEYRIIASGIESPEWEIFERFS